MGKMQDEEFNLEQMEAETEEMLQVRFLTEENAEFKRTRGGFLSLQVDREEYSRVQVVRMFPFTDPDIYISVRTPEEQSKEIGIIENLLSLKRETQEMLREQMNLRYFTPIIHKLLSIKEEYGYVYFDVMTDRGQCQFAIHMGGSSVVHLSDTRILISDIDENRFEIPNVDKLTAEERKKLDLFL